MLELDRSDSEQINHRKIVFIVFNVSLLYAIIIPNLNILNTFLLMMDFYSIEMNIFSFEYIF